LLRKTVEAEKSLYKALTMRNVFLYDAFLPIAYLLVRRLPTADRVQQAWQLIGLYERSALLAKSGLLQPLADRIQPPELFNLPAEEIEAAKAHGRTLDPDTIIADDRRTAKTGMGRCDGEGQDTQHNPDKSNEPGLLR
jgi:hypothetical protein